GGFSPGAPTGYASFKPETVLDYEAGMKSLWTIGDVQMRLNADIFFDDYKDIQRLVFPVGPTPTSYVGNASAATIKGAEINLLVVPNNWLDLSLQYSLLNARYKVFVDPSYGDLSNQDLPNSPKAQVSFTPRMHWNLANGLGTVSVIPTFYYQSTVT